MKIQITIDADTSEMFADLVKLASEEVQVAMNEGAYDETFSSPRGWTICIDSEDDDE